MLLLAVVVMMIMLSVPGFERESLALQRGNPGQKLNPSVRRDNPPSRKATGSEILAGRT